MPLTNYTNYLVSNIFGKNIYQNPNYNPYNPYHSHLREVVVDKVPEIFGDENV